jgi:TRAP-type mannitol/chloroaromatic compound transport system substrate-binding protein
MPHRKIAAHEQAPGEHDAMKSWISTAALSTGSAILALTVGTASAQDVWKVQTSMTAGESYYQDIEQHWLPKLEAMTGGRLAIELTPVGSVVPHNETMDAIAIGVLQGDITSTSYFAGRNKAFSVMGDLIAGYDRPEEIAAFCYHGGGRELLQELFDQYAGGQVKVIGCGTPAREAFVAAVPIRGVADLEGKKVRSPEGLAAEVFKRVGAAPVGLPAAETYTSVDKGVVDAADFSSYTMNDSLGFQQIARYPIYPGIHSMPIIQFTVNKAAYDALDESLQVALDVWYQAMIHDLRLRNDMSDQELVARDRADPNIEVIDWPQEERDKFRAIAQEAWAEYVAGDPVAERALEVNIDFMKRTGLLAAD